MREELLDVRLVAYRGLWDKFAAPGTPAAFVRARRRRIPFLVDLDSAATTVPDLLAEQLLQQTDALVFLMTKDAAALVQQLRDSGVAGQDNVCLIDGGAAAAVLPIETITRNRCGHYVPLRAAQSVTARDLPARRGELVLYESIDTIQSLHDMRSSPLKADAPTEERLEFARREGAVLMKVADFVELELLVNCMKWVVR